MAEYTDGAMRDKWGVLSREKRISVGRNEGGNKGTHAAKGVNHVRL